MRFDAKLLETPPSGDGSENAEGDLSFVTRAFLGKTLEQAELHPKKIMFKELTSAQSSSLTKKKNFVLTPGSQKSPLHSCSRDATRNTDWNTLQSTT